jgi:selenocysteine-specific elongation factor
VLSREALAAVPRTPRRGPPRLAIDRAFAARGFGAVVTGTLVGSELAVGDAVEILPGGARARVRGLQSHGVAAERVAPGARCAANLQGIELAQLARGQVVTRAAALEPATALDVQLTWLGTSAPAEPPVSVLLLAGTAERPARVAPIGAERLAPASTGFARIHVAGLPLPVLPGDRFIVRGFARSAVAGATLGGGCVLDTAPPRRRRSDPLLAAELEELARREPERELAVRIRRAGLEGAPRAELLRRTGRDDVEVAAALAELAARGAVRETEAGRWLDAEALARLEASLERALDAFHAAHPLEPGMPGARLRASLPANVAPDAADLALEALRARGALTVEGDRVRRSGHGPRLAPEQQALADRALAQARAAGLEPPGLREWAARLGATPERLRELFAHLERQGHLVRARGDLWFDRAAVDRLRERVLAHLRAHGALGTATYKALIGTSRRTAVPLMEHFDAERLTLRRGAVRVLRSSG